MEMTEIVILIVFAFGASFTQRVTGFGFGIFIMTVLPHIMPSYGEATALSGLLALVSVVVTAARKIRYLQWKKILPILITFLVVSLFAVRSVSHIDGRSLKHVLGAMLIAISIYFFFFNWNLRVKPGIPIQLGLGTLSGLMGGFFAMQGPPAVIYFLSSTDEKNEYIAMTSFYFVVGNVMMTVFRAHEGFVTAEVIQSWFIALPAVVAGYFVGRAVFDRMPIGKMRKFVYAFMAVSGVIALLA